jgi:NADH:ubiquinone reductase (H+-translocating)
VKQEKGDKNKIKFDYKTKGMMAEIGKRTGVAILFGRIKLHGFLAWWLWRTYYLVNLPTARHKGNSFSRRRFREKSFQNFQK